MRHRPAWAPDEIDIECPSAARMYDYYLGGPYNFAADRALAEENMRAWPDMPHITRANRAYLHRAVTFLGECGIDQFLDLGSGIPSNGNVHDVARAHNPEARTVYVDVDPVAVAHSSALLGDLPFATVIHADLRDPETVLEHPVLHEYLDLSRPIAVLMFAVLHFVSADDDPGQIIATYRHASADGSYLALSHGTDDYRPVEAVKASNVYPQASHALTFRSREQVAGLMQGYELVEPGLVDIVHWRPDPLDTSPDPLGGDVRRYSGYAAVGRKAGPGLSA